MKKLIAILALGVAALGFSTASLAQDTSASAPAAAAMALGANSILSANGSSRALSMALGS